MQKAMCFGLAIIATMGLASFNAAAKDGLKPSRAKPIITAKLDGSCDFVGCNERFSNDMGNTITSEGCTNGPSGGISYKQTWTRQADGSYTVTSRSEELHVAGCPVG